MRAVDNTVSKVHVLSTNGNTWKLYKIAADGTFEKTQDYVP